MAAEAILKIKAQGAAQTNQEFQNLRKNITGNMTAAERSVASSLSSMAAQYISLGLVIRQVGKTLSQGVEFNKFIENQTMAFEVMMKSADKAKAKVKELYDFAVESPLTFKETVSSSKQLMAYGFAAEELVPTMEKLGAVSIATGHSLSDIAYVYGTLKSQGRAYSRDLMQFGMRGIPIYEELAKVLKVDVSMIQKMASEGKIGFKEVEQAFANMTEEGGRFGGILEKYMETLTGKIAMLSDIWEQTTGKMAEGLSKVLGRAVDDLTTKLESGELDGFIETISYDVANIASGLLDIADTVITLAPILLNLFKAMAVMKIGGGIFKAILGTPEALISTATKIEALGNIFKTGTSLAGEFSTGIGLVIKALKGLAVAAAPVMGVGAIFAGAHTVYSEAGKATEAKFASDSSMREDRLLADLNRGATSGRTALLSDQELANLTVEYNLTTDAVVKAAVKAGLYTDALWEQKKAMAAASEQAAKWEKEMQARMKAQIVVTDVQKQKDFMASLTGADVDRYTNTEDIYSSLGTRGANDYIKGFADKMERDKEVFGSVFTDAMKETNLEEELKKLYEALDLGAAIPDLFENTGFDETIRSRIIEINRLLADGAKAAKREYVSLADTLKELGKWWLPEEARVQATLDAFDDLQLETEKAVHNLNEEFSARMAIVALMKDSVEKTRLEVELINQRQEAEKNIRDYMQQQADIKTYQNNLSGDPAFWQDLQVKAGQGDMGAVAMTSMEGTQIGSAIAGDPMTVAVKAIADFAMSIENVSKLMNPLTTILEAGRPLIELFLNSALQDMVNQLSALGVIIGKILAPILSLTQLFFLFTNVLYTMLLIPLELLGTGFAWFNDHVIAPAGNTIIDLINTFIGWINKYTTASLPYIASIKKTTDANETFTKTLKDAVSNATNALTGTISFLLDKFNSYIDEQVDSYQDLYDVGAISGEEYARRVGSLGDRLDPGSVNISDKDKALEGQGAIATRLMQLYSVQNKLDSGNLSEEQQLQLLMSAGLNTQSTTQLMMREAFEAAMKNVGVSTEATDMDSASKNVQEIKTLQTGVTSIPHNVNSSWDKVRDAAISMWTGLTTGISNGWSTMTTGIRTAWDSVTTGVSTAWTSMTTGIRNAWDTVTTGVSTAWDTVTTGVSTAWDTVTTGVSTAWDTVTTGVSNGWTSMTTGIQNAWDTVTTGISNGWSTMTTKISSNWSTITTGVSNGWTSMTTGVTTKWNTLTTTVSASWKQIGIAVNSTWAQIGTSVKSSWATLTADINTKWASIGKTASSAWGAITTTVGTVWDTMGTKASTFWSNMGTSWESISAKAQGIWAGVKTTASGIWDNATDGVKKVASGIWSGVQTTASNIWSGVKTTASGIWNNTTDGVKKVASGIWSGVQTSAKGIWDSVKTAAVAPWKAVGNGIIDIFNSIIKALNKINIFGADMSLIPKLAVGTPNVPYDMMAQIHQGEAVVPKTFMDGVRSGELSIGSSNNNGNNYYVTVNVEGNVTAENDLAISIAEVLYNERKAGRLAV